MSEEPAPKSLQRMLLDLKDRHRDLDISIQELELNPYFDQLAIRRLKKEKLKVKDCIAILKNRLIPDLNA